ncbi:MAG: hypothetical protein COV55_02905 [Candidatus Komeilibacteria bacterium CG11_big_fil_rev_8_21_14_0_20_36_20]|uniref:BppU N-terminal domain-containing protein n=1 Tax=Candidatus Komeilibacteria bacterium CG11_big_fil_rev_8_21_14_0_20_36_20 TaxID=1974477 RepID=A0A2H0NCR0_9BACT|nr:MAG: hypothetical protein COV55_02905 [Candidatus Komeilibacteria bacterium CG11_big_fil_rev_8_21_14_0_20_36_20]
MTIEPEEYNLTIHKGGKFYFEFQLQDDEGLPISLVGKSLKCRIKESVRSSEVLLDLTTANGGMIITDAVNGIAAISIRSDETSVDADRGVYDIIQIDNSYPTIESEYIMFGKVTFITGITPQ